MKKDNRPPKHKRTHKRGDVREDGMVFWTYEAKAAFGEYWITPEKFTALRQRAASYFQTEEGRAKHRERAASYYRTEEGRAKQRKNQALYYRTEAGRAKHRECRARALQTEEGRAKNRARQTRYYTSEKGREKARSRMLRFCKTEEGKAICAVRKSANRAAKYAGQGKPSRSFELLGTDLETFKAHIEAQFTDGMSWENYGDWHIDHIVPLASGKTPEEIWKLCHYSNLQPLWAVDNLRKGARYAESI